MFEVRTLEQEYWKHLARMDADSFRDLMVTHGQAVWNFAFCITKREDLADDVSQDVFLQVYRNIGSFRGQSSMKTWLFAITRNIAVNYMRTAFMRKVTLVDWVVRKDTFPSAEHEALNHALSDEIWSMVLKLPVKFREVLILEAKYELTNKEMAHVLGISEGTVKSRLSRARRKMTDLWKEEPLYE
jgi:RNA polymerase sigma-70 factor, ECF subfamily